MKKTYTVIDEFTVRDSKVLVLDKSRTPSKEELSFTMFGENYPYNLTHKDDWITVKSDTKFKGNKIEL